MSGSVGSASSSPRRGSGLIRRLSGNSKSNNRAPRMASSRVIRMVDEIEPLFVLVCSANMGNREPTPESFAAWVPKDGSMNEVVNETDGTTTATTASTTSSTEKKEHGNENEEKKEEKDEKFDIIAIGMQEGTFEMGKDASDDDSSLSDTDGDKSQPSSPGGAISTAVTTALDAVTAARGGVEKATNTMERTVRSVTASEDHTKAPALQNAKETIYNTLAQAASRDSADTSTRGGVDASAAGADVASTASSPPRKQRTETLAAHYGEDTQCLLNLMKDHLPSYQVVVSYLRGQMRLIILVRNEMVDEVINIETRAKNTGLGSVLANKGGIVSTLTVRNTRLGFLTAHLEAHEGQEHYNARNSNLADILSGAKVGPRPRWFDASLYNHHCFVCGDLNYRVVLPERQVDSDDDNSDQKMDHAEHVQKVFDLVEEKNWEVLNEADELGKALREKECLVGFQTPQCLFHPTFKMLREEGWKYTRQRTPSYTDRILWKSADGMDDKLKKLAYGPCPGFITSDHKPMRGAFSLVPNGIKGPIDANRQSLRAQLRTQPSTTNTSSINTDSMKPTTLDQLHLFARNMKCTNLSKKDITGSSDPYVVFMTNPVDLLVRAKARKKYFAEQSLSDLNLLTKKQLRKWPKSTCQKSELNPNWGEEEVHLQMLDVKSIDELNGCLLYISVMDQDPAEDDVIGTVVVNLQKLCNSAVEEDEDASGIGSVQIDEDLVRNGRVKGHFSCMMEVWWLDKGDRDTALTFRKSKVKKKKKGKNMFSCMAADAVVE